MGAVLVDRLRRQAEEAKRQADRLERMVELANELGDEGLSELVALLGEGEKGDSHVNGQKPADRRRSTKDGAPRGRDAVRRIVRRRPGIWTLVELRAEMEREGWFTSATGLEAAAKRLCDLDGEGRKAGRGRYVFPADYREEGAIESDRSGGATMPLMDVA